VFGEGCSTGVWYQTSDELFICEGHVELSPASPGPRVDEWAATGARLPQRYAFIRFDGTRAYAHPSDYFRNDYTEAFGKGFGIVVTGEQVYEGVEFIRTRRHLWVERGSVHFVDGSAFSGVKLGPGKPLDVAWVSPRPAKMHERPKGRVIKRLDRHAVVHIEATKGAWAKLRGGGWTETAALAPTLVSTGKNTKQSETPLGTFQIWVKLAYSDMDDIERTDIPKNYSIQDVPWVQFFKGSYGFHAAFWHNDFGRRRSHGCINLSPNDARYLFQFTQPILPPGWNAILPIPQDHPTTVQVR
jgi:hypothetical protein